MASMSGRGRALAVLAAIFGAGLGAALVLYAVAGFWLAPYLAQQFLWSQLSRQLGYSIQADSTALNPFNFSVAVAGLALKDPQGRTLAVAGEIRVDIDLSASLDAHALIAEAEADQPAVNIAFDEKGQANYAFLLPKEDSADSGPALPFLLTELHVRDGRLAFADLSGGKRFETVLSPVDIHISQLGPLAAGPTHFQLHALSGQRERLEAEGAGRLAPLALAGTAKLHNIGLGPLLAWLTDMPYSVGGRASAEGSWRYADADGLAIPALASQFNDFSLA
ncbi:MAG: DUF748 domain-containing protein, partial [Candidatus Methylumidiphilus sp.]